MTLFHLFSGLSSLFSRCLQQPGLCQDKKRSQDLKPALSCGWQGPNLLSHYLLSPKMFISRKLGCKAEPGLEHQLCNTGCQFLKQCFKHCTKHSPLQEQGSIAQASSSSPTINADVLYGSLPFSVHASCCEITPPPLSLTIST